MPRRFSFNLFRLNIEDISDLFTARDLPRIRTDAEIADVLNMATQPGMDHIQRTRSSVYKWSVREFLDLTDTNPERPLLHVILARSVLERDGLIVTDEGMSSGTSSLYPPLASTAVCLFDLSRHLVAVEHTSELAQTAWKENLEELLRTSARRLDKWSSIILEAVPEQNGIVGLFRSFERLTRMRVTLRIPNPELNRYTQMLYEDLSISGIREITQDMKNPNGLSKEDEARPYASAVLAEQGYKKGDVQFEGIRNGSYEHATSSSLAANGSVRGLRDYVRGMHASAKTKEAQRALAAIAAEIDRIHPLHGENV